MSALPPKADMDQRRRDVRFVPKADIEELGAYKKSGEPRGNRDSYWTSSPSMTKRRSVGPIGSK